MKTLVKSLVAVLLVAFCSSGVSQNEPRPRARDLGIKVGVIPTGPLNAITDVAGVKVGHTTLIQGENVRTGVTAIVPHSGNLFRKKSPGRSLSATPSAS